MCGSNASAMAVACDTTAINSAFVTVENSSSVTQFTYYRWRKEFGGMKTDQVKRLKELEKENERLRKAVSDLTLEKLILGEAASGNY